MGQTCGTDPASPEADDHAPDDRSVMSLVRRLRGVSFEWREDLQPGHSGKDLGVIAQEVEQVFPELVHTDARGYKMVNYAGLIAPLIEAVKELDARIAALEKASKERDKHVVGERSTAASKETSSGIS
jgi:hypothetical protein